MRKKFVAGNWKMYTNAATGTQLAKALVQGLGNEDRVKVAVCPPFPYLKLVGEALGGSRIQLGAQNVYTEKEGAFTGEVSPTMLVDVGCRYVIIGHSERRHKMGETDELINRKVKAALAAGLQVILCVGETLQEREANHTEQVLQTQLTAGLQGLLGNPNPLVAVTIAYEPVWAIGTGKNATPQQAQEAHAFIRGRIAKQFSQESANALTIQYGGSVKPDNAVILLHEPDVDGALVGGASLVADQFLAIIQAAA
ncbi:MAG TPA: triose-phosphate isomerase [Gemmataceae bacterium]|nr:triose-phosphate isomerase [Gemmataceae bacterium]